MRQKCGRYVCVQLLQTLNILFENIRNETSLYYLLSNNHVNSIIVHKFDFSDEEVMAYYISFLKTLSLKLNTHTIHFFYNEHTNDFPLYNEAIKFFKHSESMVRIAVRTLTLNVFKVDDKAMLKFIRDKTAAPYFSNLVWFIGEHVMELDKCVKSASEFQIKTKLADLVAEHLDHLHYLNDILCLQIDALNDVLTGHLLNKLLIPLYVYSLVQNEHSSSEEERPQVSCIVALFLLSQVFLIVSHKPLVQQLAKIILNAEMSLFSNGVPNFTVGEHCISESSTTAESSESQQHSESAVQSASSGYASGTSVEEGSNITDEEKAVAAKMSTHFETMQRNFSLSNRPFLEAIFNALDCTESDHAALFALCVLYALGHNPGINQDLLDSVLMPSEKSETKFCYNVNLAERLIQIINLSCQYSSKIRIATLQMTILLLKQLAVKGTESSLLDRHLAAIEQSREESTLMLRNFYKSEEIFLDMFEDEYEEMKKKALNVEYLMMDANLLLPPTGTPMSGIEFHKRLPCGEVERARRAIRVFFLLRDLSLTLQSEEETQLPLTNISSCVKVNDALDLNNSDIINCTVITKDGQKIKGFMVIEALQLILVDPDNKRGGWGIAKFVGFLQDIEVTGDKDDSRCLHITIHRPSSIAGGSIRSPLLAAKFVFDDHIRCMAAKQRLSKGRQKARQRKLHQIARLLELPDHIQPCPSPLRHSLHSVKSADVTRK
ncbi:Protein CLEC16A [Araneus ventricosus]|uniref:Protein CLEC16A n=1 Tax=Araneus ventricosus TaxID=182803 RepID=A0A4Y2MYJ0_ARAVE|nr:Protein CLEC16A [Araneus ventricosus]